MDKEQENRKSPSSRRAWIEIACRWGLLHLRQVALLAEGVDRNSARADQLNRYSRSPSSRRAWIEIATWLIALAPYRVALLAEGVDRNIP